MLVPALKRQARSGDAAKATREIHTPENRLSEAVGLANAIDLDIIDSAIVPISEPRPSTLLGSGKVDELGQRVQDLDIGLVVVDHALTPVQQRNLEKTWNTKVVGPEITGAVVGVEVTIGCTTAVFCGAAPPLSLATQPASARSARADPARAIT